MPYSTRGEAQGLRAAAEIVAREAKAIAGTFSRKIPPTITFRVRGTRAYVSAGGPGGREAPNAIMFETGKRHPLFGMTGRPDAKRGKPGHGHWYPQPFRPFLEEAAERRLNIASEAYADKTIDAWLRQSRL